MSKQYKTIRSRPLKMRDPQILPLDTAYVSMQKDIFSIDITRMESMYY